MDNYIPDKTRWPRRVLFGILVFIICILIFKAYLMKYAPRNGGVSGYICDFLLRYIVIFIISVIIKRRITIKFLKFEKSELYYMRIINRQFCFIGLMVIDYLLYTKSINPWLIFLCMIILWLLFVLIEALFYYYLDCGDDAKKLSFRTLLKKVLVMDYAVLAVLLVVAFLVCVGLNGLMRHHQGSLDDEPELYEVTF